METESSLIKHRRYDLSMSKRTRKANIPMVSVEVSTEDRLIVFASVTYREEKEKEEDRVQPIISERSLLKETLFVRATSRPSLKQLMQVTNKETDAAEVTEQDLVRDTVSEEDKEDNMLTLVVHQQHRNVTGMKSPGMVRRCAKALNQIIKVRYSPKQKNAVPLIAI